MSTCAGCVNFYWDAIKEFHKDDTKSLELLRSHSVLPREVKCPRCDSECVLNEQGIFCCYHSVKLPKKGRRKRCGFSVSQFSGTFLGRTRISPSKIVCFVLHFLNHNWDHQTVLDNLRISTKTSVDWRSFCCEVTERWFDQQEPIGGPGKTVEIDETILVRRKYNRGRVLAQVWLFGGIERETKKKFIVPLVEEKRDKVTLFGYIQKFVLPGSTIHSDGWAAYRDIAADLGHNHYVINHSENFVRKEGSVLVHTQMLNAFGLM